MREEQSSLSSALLMPTEMLGLASTAGLTLGVVGREIGEKFKDAKPLVKRRELVQATRRARPADDIWPDLRRAGPGV